MLVQPKWVLNTAQGYIIPEEQTWTTERLDGFNPKRLLLGLVTQIWLNITKKTEITRHLCLKKRYQVPPNPTIYHHVPLCSRAIIPDVWTNPSIHQLKITSPGTAKI